MAANKASAGVQEHACGALRSLAGAQFTCFTGTKVQILTLKVARSAVSQVLSLLALLAQKCKY
jgi:hypothetical protein